MRKGLRRAATVGVCVLGLVLAVSLTPQARAIRSLWQHGIITDMVSDEPNRAYDPSRTGNLKAIYTALMLYQESEDHFPAASGWMDAIETRLRANDTTEAEAEKKLKRPGASKLPGTFGYALNDGVALKYKGDLKDPKMVLVYESRDLSRNAHGTPSGSDALVVTVSGDVRHL